MKFSAVMPTYNQAGTLGDALAGVIPQVDELIVVNDGSTDETRAMLDGLPDHVQVVHLPENSGWPAEPINKGFSLTTGDIVTWVSSDNLYYDNWRETLEGAMEDDVGMAYTSFQSGRSGGRSNGPKFRPYDKRETVRNVNCLFGMSFAIRREVWESAGDHRPGLCHDYEHCLLAEEECWRRDLRIVGVDVVTGWYNMHENRVTHRRRKDYNAPQLRDAAVERRRAEPC